MAFENVWFKSRLPGANARVTSVWVESAGKGYADVIREGRRFRFSHATVLHDQTGPGFVWLVFEDAGAA